MSTAATAKLNLSISSLPIPTVSDIPVMLDQRKYLVQRNSSVNTNQLIVSSKLLTSTTNIDARLTNIVRPTTESEMIIGEIRGWAFLEENWDGEGAHAPADQSIKDAVNFVRLIKGQASLPQPMIHATGHVSLYWNENGLYADIEFLGDGRIAYFVKRTNEDKHKGVLSFDSQEIPNVFSILIGI